MTADARLALNALVALLVCIALARSTPVPKVAAERPATPVRSAEAARLRDGLTLDPNVATAGDLDLLPGVGPSLAARIIEARKQGPFLVPEDLRRVRGIGKKTLERLMPFLRFPSKQLEHAAEP